MKRFKFIVVSWCWNADPLYTQCSYIVVFFTKKNHLNHYHNILPLVNVWHDALSTSSWPGQQWRCYKQDPFPIKFIVLSLPGLICSHTGPVSAVQTHSHSPTIIMMCPMPPIHGAALLMHCRVSHVHTLTDTHTFTKTFVHAYKETTHAHTKITHAHAQSHKSSLKCTQANTPVCSHSLNLSITRVKSLSVSEQQFNTFHSLADTRLFLS